VRDPIRAEAARRHLIPFQVGIAPGARGRVRIAHGEGNAAGAIASLFTRLLDEFGEGHLPNVSALLVRLVRKCKSSEGKTGSGDKGARYGRGPLVK
jgi:hypothetical protein